MPPANKNVANGTTQQIPIDDSGKILNVTVNMPSTVQTGTGLLKFTGTSVKDDQSPNKKVYLSIRKEQSYYVTESILLKFKDRTFITDNPQHQEVIEADSKFGVEVFEGSYPEHVMRKFEEDKKLLTRDEEEHEK